MNILEKLRESKVDIEIEAVVSMPIVNSIGEFIFVYYTKPNESNRSYSLDKIKCIYAYPFGNDDIEIKSADEFLPNTILEKVEGAAIKPTVFGTAAMEKEEKCIGLYSKMIDSIKNKEPGSDSNELVSTYQGILFELIPKSVLREIYEYLLQM